jgi:hypothetical protein
MNLVGGGKDMTLKDAPGCPKHNLWSGVYWSKDGGRTWQNGMLPGYPGDDEVTALSAYECASDPVVAFAQDGTVYYTSLLSTSDHTATGPGTIPQPIRPGTTGNTHVRMGISVTRSFDGGETWQDAVIVEHRETQNGEGGLDKQWIVVDPASGQVYLSYIVTGNTDDGGKLFVVRSDDRGLTWSEPVIAAQPGEGLEAPYFVQFAQVGVGPGGVVHFVYVSAGENGEPFGVFHKVSRDQGKTWEGPTTVGAALLPLLGFSPVAAGPLHYYRVSGNPAIAVDPASGAVYVAYPAVLQGQPAPSGTAANAIFVAISTDQGKSWTPARVNDDVAQASPPWQPAIAIGPEGTVHATWIDYRDDPSGQLAHIYYAFSKDGGKTWSANARVSDVPFDGKGGEHQNGSGFVGDYMGLVATREAVVPLWADTRTGRNDVFSAVILAV